MRFFYRDFKKSTAMCKVHNVGLRYINIKKVSGNVIFINLKRERQTGFPMGHTKPAASATAPQVKSILLSHPPLHWYISDPPHPMSRGPLLKNTLLSYSKLLVSARK
jgi:hypothetical protein